MLTNTITRLTITVMAVAISVLFSAGQASAQFLRDSTHRPPVFYNDNNTLSYFEGEDWLQNPSSLRSMRNIDIPFEWAQGWIKDRKTFNRALVMGQPESCPLMAGIYGAPDEQTAIRLAFTSCFYQLDWLEPHQKENCGCQLAMINEVVYVEPGSFTNFAASPAIVEFGDGSSDVLGIVYFGDDLVGRNQDIRLVDSRGKQRCEGTYNINAFLSNSLDLDCDFFCEPYDGSIKIRNFSFGRKGFKPTAEVKGQTCSGVSATIKVGKMRGE